MAGRASLLVLGAAAFMVSADARVIDPLLHIIAGQFGTSVAKASVVISAYALPYGFFQLFYGPIGDRIGKLRIMSYCLALFAIGTFGCAFVPNLPIFAILRFLTGVVAAAVIPMSLGYIGDKFPYEERQAALGRFMSALMLGQILSSSLGGIFGQYIGWRDIFIVFGIVSLVVAAGLYNQAVKYPEARKEGSKLGFSQYGNLIRRPAAGVILGVVLVEGFFVFGGMAYLGASLRDRFHLPYGQIGLMLGGFGLGGLIYSFTVKKLVKKIGDIGIMLLGGSLLAIGYIAIAMTKQWQWFIPFNILLGMGYYTMHGTLQTRATEMAPEARGTAVSLFAFAFFMGQSTGPMVLGRILESSGYPSVFTTAGIGLFLLAVAGKYLFARSAKRAAQVS